MVSEAELVAIIGIIGAIVGTVVGAALEPLRLRFTQSSKVKAATMALYKEVAQTFEEYLQILIRSYDAEKEAFNRRIILEVSPGGGLGALYDWDSFKIYDAVKHDPILFYQLKDAIEIEDAYRGLRHYQNNFKNFSQHLLKENLSFVQYDKENDNMRYFVCGLGAIIVQFAQGLPNIDTKLFEKVSGGSSPLIEKSKLLRLNPTLFERFRKDASDKTVFGDNYQKCDELYTFFFKK